MSLLNVARPARSTHFVATPEFLEVNHALTGKDLGLASVVSIIAFICDRVVSERN